MADEETEPPTQRPIQQRIDPAAGDVETLIDLGAVEPPSEPAPA